MHAFISGTKHFSLMKFTMKAFYLILTQRSIHSLLYNSNKAILHADWFIVAIWFFSLLFPVRAVRVSWVRVASPSVSTPALVDLLWLGRSFVPVEALWLVTAIIRLVIDWKRHRCWNHHKKEESNKHGLKSAMRHLRMTMLIFVYLGTFS